MLLSAKQCKPGARCPVASVTEAAYCSVHHDDAGRPVSFFAEQMGVRPQTLNDQLNPDQETDFISFRRLPSLLATLQNTQLLEYMAALAGCIVFKLPTGRAAEERAQAKAVREFAQYLEQASSASEDGEFTDDEVAKIEHEANEAVAAIVAHVAALKAQRRTRSVHQSRIASVNELLRPGA